MKVEAIHHVPMRPEFKSPFSAAFAIEGGRLIFFSGCCTIPTYHKHPHDPEEERQWLAADFRAQTERTFAHIKEIMDAAGARMTDILKLTIFTTDMGSQNILNEISAFQQGQAPGAHPGGRTHAGASGNADRDRGCCGCSGTAGVARMSEATCGPRSRISLRSSGLRRGTTKQRGNRRT
jgi:enamine deaminase RidA (YjgF/YER057c/UK114 family)